MHDDQFSDDLPDNDDLIDEDAAAVDLHVKVGTLASWRATGRGPDFYKFGRIIRYSRRLNAEWKARQRKSPRQPKSASQQPAA
jgi:hypothetical protein